VASVSDQCGRTRARHPGEGRDPVYGNAVNLPRRECDDRNRVVAHLFTVCDASFCIRKNWTPRARGVTHLH